jgi:hypothetical protein
MERDNGEVLKDTPRIFFCVERESRRVLREAPAVGIRGVLFLEVPTVGQDNVGERLGARGGEDLALKPLAAERGQVPRVVNMCMGEEYGINAGGIDREWLPVPQPQGFQALEQPTID